MNAEWLKKEMEAIAERLKEEGAEGVIVAVLYKDEDNRYSSAVLTGMLSLMDGFKLAEHVTETLSRNRDEATTEAPQ